MPVITYLLTCSDFAIYSVAKWEKVVNGGIQREKEGINVPRCQRTQSGQQRPARDSDALPGRARAPGQWPDGDHGRSRSFPAALSAARVGRNRTQAREAAEFQRAGAPAAGPAT